MSRLKLKVGIVGAGGRGILSFGKEIVTRNDAQVVALCDPNPGRMELAAKELGFKPKFHTSVKDMTAAEKLDAVVITSPDFCHESNAVDALDSGANVLIDKPLSTTVKGCQNIIGAAERAGKVIMMGFNLRHHAVLKKLKKILV